MAKNGYELFRDMVRGWDQTRSLQELKDESRKFGDVHARFAFWNSIRDNDRDISTFLLDHFSSELDIFEEDIKLCDDLETVEEFMRSVDSLPVVEAQLYIGNEHYLHNAISMMKRVRVNSLAIKSIADDLDRVSTLSNIFSVLLETDTESLTAFECSFREKEGEDVDTSREEVKKISDFIGKCKNLEKVYVAMTTYTLTYTLAPMDLCSIIDSTALTESINNLGVCCTGYDPSIFYSLQSFASQRKTKEIDWVSSGNSGHVLLTVMTDVRTIVRIRVIDGKVYVNLTIREGHAEGVNYLFSILLDY